MNNLPREKQVCSREQARELAELLDWKGPHSSYLWTRSFCNGWFLALARDYVTFPHVHKYCFPAYTGDELGVLLPKYYMFGCAGDDYRFDLKSEFTENGFYFFYYSSSHWDMKRGEVMDWIEARAKAALAIQGLTEGWIKKDDFKYDAVL